MDVIVNNCTATKCNKNSPIYWTKDHNEWTTECGH